MKALNDGKLNYIIQKIKTLLNGKAPTDHTHDGRYYTEAETDAKYASKTAFNVLSSALVPNKVITEIITSSKTWTMPTGVKNNAINVRIFGGGGGGGSEGAGGGGGEMAVQSITLTPGTQVLITIGAGGAFRAAGGASAFGGYLSASGGAAGNMYDGGSGGSGGGGGGDDLYTSSGTQNYYYYAQSGGNATYGGGGGTGYGTDFSTSHYNVHGGNGGTYGGGGGITNSGHIPGTGGTYGGMGNSYDTSTILAPSIPSVDGTDTRGMGLEFEGDGKASQTNYGGGGGYGGRGGNSLSPHGGAGGGGGYGADGGNGSPYGDKNENLWTAGGGGGGYGGRGGHAGYHQAGGGGGYGRDGAGGDGADYFLDDRINYYYHLFDRTNGGIAAGGAGATTTEVDTHTHAGGDGICIITYTLEV